MGGCNGLEDGRVVFCWERPDGGWLGGGGLDGFCETFGGWAGGGGLLTVCVGGLGGSCRFEGSGQVGASFDWFDEAFDGEFDFCFPKITSLKINK